MRKAREQNRMEERKREKKYVCVGGGEEVPLGKPAALTHVHLQNEHQKTEK